MEALLCKAIRCGGQYLGAPFLLLDGVDLAHAINRLNDLSIKYRDRAAGQQTKKWRAAARHSLVCPPGT
jgi:hypothetical protein